MRAVQFAQYGDSSALLTVDVEEPHAGPGQVRVAVRAAGVNPVDWKIRSGFMAEQMPLRLPSGIGMDAAGVVDEVGEGVSDVAVGDHVFGIGFATYAEYAVLGSWARTPAALDLLEAGGYPVPVETAIRSLDQLGVIGGQTLLISGASGGVGSAAIQVARARGIEVIGTASEANQDYLRSLGATATPYGAGLAPRVTALAPNGVDAALHLAGEGLVPELIELTGEPSRVLSLCDYGAGQYGALVPQRPTDPAAALAQAAALITDGVLRIPVQEAFTLETSAKAHDASQAGHVAGRFVIAVG
jgi:NADPH:quinone reductase-like Zn-dependent oxidoreductase